MSKKNKLDVKAHDPIARQLPNEPRFPLMGRDPRSEVLIAVYAYLRERKWDQAVSALQAGIERLKGVELRPDKDKAHAAAARQVATDMFLWRKYNMTPATPRGRPGSADAAAEPVLFEAPVEPEAAS